MCIYFARRSPYGDDYHILFFFGKIIKLILCLLLVEKCFLVRGHPEFYRGPLNLQSNALPLSYIPIFERDC